MILSGIGHVPDWQRSCCGVVQVRQRTSCIFSNNYSKAGAEASDLMQRTISGAVTRDIGVV